MRELRAFIRIGYDEYICPVGMDGLRFIRGLVDLKETTTGNDIRASLTYRMHEEEEEETKENDLEPNTKND